MELSTRCENPGVEQKVQTSSQVCTNVKNKITAINTLAVPAVTYNCGVVDWKLDEIQGLYKLARKQLFMNRNHVMKADVNRIYLLYQKGGRELMNLEKV